MVRVRIKPMTVNRTILDQSGVIDVDLKADDTIIAAKEKIAAASKIPADEVELKFQTNFIGRRDNEDEEDEGVPMSEATTFFKWHEKFPE